MTRVNYDLLAELHQQSIVSLTAATYGEPGEIAASLLIQKLRYIHAELPVETLPDGLIVFCVVSDFSDSPLAAQESVSDLTATVTYPHRGMTVEVRPDGYRVLSSLIDIPSLQNAIAYSFEHPATESWHVGGENREVFNPLPGTSIFSTPIFTELEDALTNYAVRQVVACRCQILQRAWRDHRRLIWRQKPESTIRRSLEQHLVSTLRAFVEVEHIVDEAKPVDIHVQWPLSTQAALIECKWMGVSLSDPDASGHQKRTEFGAATAVAGLRQLADYLDRKRSRSSGRNYMGYLAVIDGRRKGLGDDPENAAPSNADLYFYEHAAIEWPEEVLARPDIGPPLRAFCRPVVT